MTAKRLRYTYFLMSNFNVDYIFPGFGKVFIYLLIFWKDF